MTTMKNHNVFYSAWGGGGAFCAGAMAVFAFALAACANVADGTEGWMNVDPGRTEVQPQQQIWKADLSQWPEGFEVKRNDGAEGHAELVDTEFGKAIRIVKSNDAGYITVTPKKPLIVPKGARLQGYVHYTSATNDPEYSVGVVRLMNRHRKLYYFNGLDERGTGGPKMHLLINTAPGTRERKTCRYLADDRAGTNVLPAIAVAGVASDSTWSDWGVEDLVASRRAWSRHVESVSARDHSGDRMDAESYRKLIAADRDHTAKVVPKNGRAALLVDGEEVPPILFKGVSHFRTDLAKNTYCGRKMAEAGVNIQVVNVRFGKTPPVHGWWSKDKFDAAGAVSDIEDAMRMAPYGYFILSVNVTAYPEFADEHPDETWLMPDGSKVYGNYLYAKRKEGKPFAKDTPAWTWPSISSRVLRREICIHLAELVAGLKERGLSKRIVGIHVAGYNDGQLSTPMPDFSKPAVAGFRRWQEKTFGKIKWNDPPTYDDDQEFFCPGRDDHRIAYFRYLKQCPMEFMEDIAREFKRLMGKDILSTRWCMSPFKGQYNDALDVTQFANSDVIDIITPQPSYTRRTPGLTISTSLPMASFRHHGKLMVNEFDLRTYGAVHPGETEQRVTYLSQARDPGMWRTIYRKVAAGQVAARMGWWFFDMSGGWFEPEPINADIADSVKTYRELIATPSHAPDPATLALVIDEEGLYCRNTLPRRYVTTDSLMTTDPVHALSAASVPYDIWLADDFIRDPSLAAKYRTLVFVGMLSIDAPRKALLDSLKSGGRTLVFLNRTGIVGGAEETGFSFKTEKGKSHKEHETVPAQGVADRMMSLSQIMFLWRYLGGQVTGPFWNPPRMALDETPEIAVKARYRSDGAVATAERAFPGWKSVYVAECGGLSPQYLNRLVRESGGYAPVDRPGIVVEMNADFLSVHCTIPGRYDFRLPFEADVVNLKTHRETARGATRLTMDLTAGETRWYRFQNHKNTKGNTP